MLQKVTVDTPLMTFQTLMIEGKNDCFIFFFNLSHAVTESKDLMYVKLRDLCKKIKLYFAEV